MKLTNIVITILLFSSCGNNRSNDESVDLSERADTVFKSFENPGTAYEVVEPGGFYVWEVNVKNKTLKKNPAITTANIDVDSVINGLNRRYENIPLKKISMQNDTINLAITDSDYLTSQIGSSGAAQYIAQAVINLASVPGINYVHIDFTGGEHAMPGTWSKKNFPGYIIIQ